MMSMVNEVKKVFRRPEIFRPPSEAGSYFLPLTRGCSNNTCTFCRYHGASLQVREIEEVKTEIDALDLYIRSQTCLPEIHPVVYMTAPHLASRKIFLQDGDAMVYPYPALVEALEYLNEKFPWLERIAAYATPQDLLRRSGVELRQLKDLKLSLLYIGPESGDDEVLRRIHKGVSREEIIEACLRAKEAGMTLSLTVLLGLGGVAGSERHASLTASLLTLIDPEYAGALTLTPIPGTPLYQDIEEGRFAPISPFQSLEELRIMIKEADFTRCFFSSMHASNYLAVRGTLPQNREQMLKQIETVLRQRDESLLRPEFLRGL